MHSISVTLEQELVGLPSLGRGCRIFGLEQTWTSDPDLRENGEEKEGISCRNRNRILNASALIGQLLINGDGLCGRRGRPVIWVCIEMLLDALGRSLDAPGSCNKARSITLS
jgi:hypothetical protein